MDPTQFDRILLVHALLRALYTWHSKCGVNIGRSVRSDIRDLLSDLFVWQHQIDWGDPQVAELETYGLNELLDLVGQYPGLDVDNQTGSLFDQDLSLIDNDRLIIELAAHLRQQSRVEGCIDGGYDDLIAQQVQRLIGGSDTPDWPLEAVIHEARERQHLITRQRLDAAATAVANDPGG